MLLLQSEERRALTAGRARGGHYKASSLLFILLIYLLTLKAVDTTKQGTAYTIELERGALRCA